MALHKNRPLAHARVSHLPAGERSQVVRVGHERLCSLSAANAIKSFFTGVDLAADFRGLYKTEIGAFKTIKKLTGGTTVADAAEYCAKQAGLVEHKHPLMAKSGDLVIVNNGGNLIAGVVHLNGRHVVSVSETGLVRLLICDRSGKSNIVRAWSI